MIAEPSYKVVPRHDRFFVQGRWFAPSAAGTLAVYNASTGRVIARVPAGQAADIDTAVAAARTAFDPWSQLPREARAEYLQRIADGLHARAGAIARIIAQETGMPIALSEQIQAGLPVFQFNYYAKLLRSFAFEHRIGNSVVRLAPAGVVGAITPWNYPLFLAAAKIAPALAAGCTVVLKPGELAPLSTFILGEVVEEAGLPPGVLNIVVGAGVPAGEALVQHPDVDLITFTGSPRAGRRILELAAPGLKRVALELGGKSASLLLEDADLDRAIPATVANCFLNSGQTCTALTRLLVPVAQFQRAAEQAVAAAQSYRLGDALSEATTLGPLVSAAQRERVRSHIRRGVAEGAPLLCGGAETPPGLEHGFFVKPTIFGPVNPRAAVAQEEIFGPVLCILTYRDEAEAVRIANDSPYGLSGAVWSRDLDRARAVASRLRTGQVAINGGPFNPLAPFGGFKQSGHGREGGPYGLNEFLELQSLQMPQAA